MQRICASAEHDIVRVFGAGAANCRLQVTSEVFRQDAMATVVKFKISGQLNGRAVKKTISVVHKSIMSTGVAHGVGGVLGAALATGVSHALSSAAHSRGNPQLEKCMQNCMVDVRLFIEEQGPRAATSEMDRYHYSKLASIGLGVVATLVSTIALHEQMVKPYWLAAFFFGAINGAMFGGSAYVFSLALLPTSFFFNTPRGRWLLTKSQCSTVGKARAGYVAMAAICALWVVGMTSFPTIVKVWQQHFPQPPVQQQMPAGGRR